MKDYFAPLYTIGVRNNKEILSIVSYGNLTQIRPTQHEMQNKQTFIQILKDRDVTYDYYKYIQLDLKSQRKKYFLK